MRGRYNDPVNETHLIFLASPEWAQMLETDLLPWVDRVGDLGDDVLEIGPGPGLTTDLVRPRVQRMTAVELDESLATALRDRLAGTNVEVITGDGTQTGLEPDRFSTAMCFSMLHHMPSPDLQDALFAEVFRVLRPGGVFVGVDSLPLDWLAEGHKDDTWVPIDPETLPNRFARAGFPDLEVDVGDYQFRFVARKP